MADEESALSAEDVRNEFMINSGQNLPNHSESMRGRGKFVQTGTGIPPVFRTRQQVGRFVGHLFKHMDAIDLPDEDDAPDLDSVIAAIEG